MGFPDHSDARSDNLSTADSILRNILMLITLFISISLRKIPPGLILFYHLLWIIMTKN